MKHILPHTLLLLFSLSWITAQADISQIVSECIPKLTYFDKNVYNASNQTWAIAQNKKGYLFFANSGGLLEYDGSQWTLYSIPANSSMVRSVAQTINGSTWVCKMILDFGQRISIYENSFILLFPVNSTFTLRMKMISGR
jgi:ligand-binding sensor domain-containing protein